MTRGSGIIPFQAGSQWLAQFSRASTGTYIDQNGVMQVAAANTPRIDWSSGKPVLLVEAAATNYLPNSESATPGSSGAFTVASSTAVPPLFSGATVWLSTVTGTSSEGDFANWSYTPPVSSPAPMTHSLWVWLPSSLTATAVAIRNDGFTVTEGGKSADLSKRDQWQRIWLKGVADYEFLVAALLGWSVGDEIYCCCPQAEYDQPVTSYIPTSGAIASRAADIALFVEAPPVQPSGLLAPRSADQVLGELLAIGPQGDGMPTHPDDVYATMLAPIAHEFAGVELLLQSFATEIDPETAENLLTDFERVLGPDPFGRDTTALSIGQRQQLAYSRWTGKYGVRPADFIALAATFGVTITIQEYKLTTAGAAAGTFLVNHPVQFAWVVTLPATVVTVAEASSAQAGDLVSSFAPSLAQPAIAGRAPAHTNPYFSYTG